MTSTLSRKNPAPRSLKIILRAAVLFACGLLNSVCLAQNTTSSNPAARPDASRSDQDKPLTTKERDELLNLIQSLQQRLDKLEAAQPTTASTSLKHTSTPVP